MKRIIKAFFISLAAIKFGWKNEAALRQELALLIVAIPAALLISSNPWKILAMLGTLLFLLAVEFLNTGIEKLADRTTRETDPLIKIAKDCGSAAVLMALLLAGSVWILALWERLYESY